MEGDSPQMPAFVAATARRTAVAGLVGAVALGFWVSLRFGVSVAVGAALGAGNFALIAFIARRMFDLNAGRDQADQSPHLWSGLLVAKMTLLLVVAGVLVLYGGVDPIGLSVGFTIFVIAALWSALEVAQNTDSMD